MAPWLCSGSSGSLSSRAENWSGKQKDAGLSVSEQRALGEKSIRRKRRADWRAGRGGQQEGGQQDQGSVQVWMECGGVRVGAGRCRGKVRRSWECGGERTIRGQDAPRAVAEECLTRAWMGTSSLWGAIFQGPGGKTQCQSTWLKKGMVGRACGFRCVCHKEG